MTIRQKIHGVVVGFPLGTAVPMPWLISSYVVTNFVYLIIILSTISFSVSTLPQLSAGGIKATNDIEFFCVAVFTLELIVRALTCDSQVSLWTSPLTWIDVMSVLPLYVQLILSNDNAAAALVLFRVLRLFRIVRVFKLLKNHVGFEAIVESLISSKEALSLMGFMILIALFTLSSIIYFAELQGCTFDAASQQWIYPNGKINPFSSVFAAMWWCIVTITTVGYGDMVPITGAGKATASFATLCGVFVISFPTAIISGNFIEIHARKLRERKELAEKTGLLPDLNAADAGKNTDNVLSADALNEGCVMDDLEADLSYSIYATLPRRAITLSDNSEALYDPGLVLQTCEVASLTLVARREPVFPTCARNIVFSLVLTNALIERCVARALVTDEINYSPTLTLRQKRVRRLVILAADIPQTLLNNGIYMVAAEYSRPVGQVPVVFHCPDEAAESSLLNVIRDITLTLSTTTFEDATERKHMLSLSYCQGATVT